MIDPSRPDQVARALLGKLADSVSEPNLDYAEAPARLAGGNHTWVYGFRLDHAPKAWSGPLVVRILRPHRDAEGVRREEAVQNALAARSYPAPRVLASSPEPQTLGGAFLVMERLAGAPLVSEDPRDGLARAILGDWPQRLAEIHARLHEIDVDAFERSISRAGLRPEELTLTHRLAGLAERVDAHGLDGLRAGVDWLTQNAPRDAEPVICHGDLFPNQVFASDGEVSGVIDWSEACIAPAEVDVGIVKAGIETLPVPLPGPLVHGAALLQRGLMRRFVRAYASQRALDASRLHYGEVLRCVEVLVAVAVRRREADAPEAADRPPQPYDHAIALGRMRGRIQTLARIRLEL